MIDVGPNTLKLAKVLQQMFDMQFSRAWDDLPSDEYRQLWIENAQDLIQKMKPQ